MVSCGADSRQIVKVYILRLCTVQIVLADIMGMRDNGAEVFTRMNDSIVNGASCKLVGGRHRVCLFTCLRYNYCHTDQSCCTDPMRLPISLTTYEDLMLARVKVRGYLKTSKELFSS